MHTLEKIPVHIISGFLGSGKTTAIIRLLKEKQPDEKWAVLVNEFGRVSIDGQTIRSGSKSEAIFDIAGGCICCSAKEYFRENLEQILGAQLYRRIIIEPSGLGGIEMVSEIVRTLPALELMPVICMVDICSLESPRLQGNMIYKAQINQSDAIAFSKCDLVKEKTTLSRHIEKFRTLFPGKLFYISSENLLLYLTSPGLTGNSDLPLYRAIIDAVTPGKDVIYGAKTLQFDSTTIFDPVMLHRFFRENPCILRAKGNILSSSGWLLINYTASGFTCEPTKSYEESQVVLIYDNTALTPIF